MKSKLLTLLMTILMIFTLAACKPGDMFEYTAPILQQIDTEIGLPTETTTNLTLKSSFNMFDNDFSVTWTSGNPAVISNTGVVTRPTAETGDVSVVMSALVFLTEDEEISVTRTFTVVVKALEPVIVTYTVTFNANGGSAVAAVVANSGATITAPTAPTRSGYTFDGWYKEAGLTTAWIFATDTVNANITLYAKWIAIPTYTVTFDPNNGGSTFTQTVQQGGFATQPTTPMKAGYQFVSWQTLLGTVFNFTTNAINTDVTLVAQYDLVTYTITYVIPEGAELSGTGFTTFNVTTLVDDLGSAMLANHAFLGWFTEAVGGTQVAGYPVGTTGNKTLYAQFEEDEQFSVTFDDMIGGINTVTLYYGYVDEPVDPTREGYTFGGWYKDTDFVVLHDFEFDIISADITLYAKWTRVIPEGYTPIYTTEEFYQMTLSSSTGGFFLMNDLDFAEYVWVAHNNSFRGIFDGDGHMIKNLTITSAVAGNYGGIFPRANGATIKNFAVDDLTVDVQNRAGGLIGRVENGKVNVQDIIITKFRVHGTANEGVGILVGQVSFEFEASNISITSSMAFSTNKYASLFIGRADAAVFASDIFIADSFAEITATNTDAGAAGIVAYTNHANANVTVSNLVIIDSFLHGKYAGAIGGYQNLGQIHVSNAYVHVTFTYMDAPNSGVISRVVSTAGTTMNFVYLDLVLEKPMHAQVLASTQPQRQSVEGLSPQFFTDHLSMIATSALWVLNTPIYQLESASFTFSKPTVTYHPRGGTEIPALRLIEGMNAFITGTTTREGYIFDGWYKDEALTVPFDFDNEVILVDTTIYAKWTEIEKFTVTLNSNGGSAVDPIDNVLDGSTIAAPTAPTREGYTFDGWYKDIGLTESFGFGTEPVTSNITLYAKWTPIVYDITYVLFDGEYLTADLTFTVMTPSITFGEASKAGYEFLGWFDLPSGGTAVTGVAQGTIGNVTVYAQYSPITYTALFETNGGTLDPLFFFFTVESETIELPIPTREGYLFVGWFDEQNANQTHLVQGSLGHRIFNAEWSELIEINFFDFIAVDAQSYMPLYFDGMYTEYAIYDGHLYGRGDNAFGHLANGTNQPSEHWVYMTPYFNLNPDEYIVEYFLYAPTFLVITSENRVLVWGLMGFDEFEEPEFIFSPSDMTLLFNLNGAEIEYVAHLFFTILVQTSDLRILALQSGAVSDVTPVLNPGETIGWTMTFGGEGVSHSNTFYTGERIFIFPFMGGNAFIDLTDAYAFVEGEDIYAIFAQGGGVHVVTSMYYRFAQLTEDEENPVFALAIDIDLTLLPGETIVSNFGGGGLFTSEQRILLPVYLVDEMDLEFPIEVIFHDVTASLDLEVGEAIEAIYSPFFVLTTFKRLLIVIPDESFTTDPQTVPNVEILEISLDALMETEVIVDIQMTSGDPVVITDMHAYVLLGSMEGLGLEKVTLEVMGLIYTGIYPMIDLDLFEPEDRPYHDFEQWYLDPELTIPFDPETAYDGMNLYAGWVETHYLIQFFMSFEDEQIDPIYVPFGSVADEPVVLDREHSEFQGWYYYDALGNYQSYDFTYAIDAHVILYPMWISKTYTVTLVFDEIEGSTEIYGSALMELQWLSINAPEGYEILGIYVDEEMTIPWNPNAQLEGALTLYIDIEPLVLNIYYFLDVEETNFETYYVVNDVIYAVTFDGRVFAWGYNGNGSLGIGFEGLFFVSTPFEMTDLFNFAPGEMIENIYGESSAKVMTTTDNRVFMWGYPDSDYNYYHTPQDITALLNLSSTDLVVFARPLWSEAYFLTLEGKLIVFEYYNQQVHTFDTLGTFFDVLLFANFGTSSDFIVIETSRVLKLTLDLEFGNVYVDDQSMLLDGGMIVGRGFDYETYMYDLFYTSNGKVFKYNGWTSVFELHDTLTLNPGEQILFASDNFGTTYFVTDEGRLLYTWMSDSGVIDTSALAMGEEIIGIHQSLFYTNLGKSYVVNGDNELDAEFSQAFDITGPVEIVGLLIIGYEAYGITNEGMYLYATHGAGIMELEFFVGTNLQIEQAVYGEVFDYLVPDARMGYVFEGWYPDAFFNMPYFEDPSHDLMLYALWVELPE